MFLARLSIVVKVTRAATSKGACAGVPSMTLAPKCVFCFCGYQTVNKLNRNGFSTDGNQIPKWRLVERHVVSKTHREGMDVKREPL